MELCTKGNLDDIKKEFELLKREINLQDDKGYSALVYSVSSGHAEVVKYLLEQGADKKLTSKAGYDAVYFAEKNNQHEIVDLLKKIAS
jgi:ankyrin repeat protein